MVSALSFNNNTKSSYKKSEYVRKTVNPYCFSGLFLTNGRDKLEIKPKSIAQINEERSLMLASFLTKEADAKYNMEKQFVQRVKNEILGMAKNGIVTQPFEIEDGWEKVNVTADYEEKAGDIKIKQIIRSRKNGSYDTVDINEKGEITKITNGIFTLPNGTTIIKEEMLYKDGMIERLRIDTTNKRTKSYTLTEILYSGGKIKEARESVTRSFLGTRTIGKREFFNK